jgi:hypothetical protein
MQEHFEEFEEEKFSDLEIYISIFGLDLEPFYGIYTSINTRKICISF